MSKRDLLLEIGLEELPARFVTNAMNDLAKNVTDWLSKHKVDFGEVTSYSTPRRLAVLVKDVSESQADINEEVRGPAKKIALDENEEWSKAAIGFTRGQGLTVDDIYFKEINGVEYVHVKKFIEGTETEQLLPQLEKIVTSISFPINMRWASNDLRYIRPIKWIVALFGNGIIPFSITNVSTNNSTKGHRFLGKQIRIESPDSYEEQLKAEYVIVDPKKREQLILDQLKEIEAKNNWVINIDEDLLAEITNLLEYPTALYGQFEDHFLNLPEEVLVTSMREHQRYFSVRNSQGELLPYFVTVRNGNDHELANVARGNEKVLKARLADAEFFYEEDKNQSIDSLLEKLKTVVYHEEIGTITEKGNRVRELSNKIANELSFSNEEKTDLDRAAEICKFDLVTLMVNEFPELQGFMGEKYALLHGENEVVAKAVDQHYKPRFAGDLPPENNVSAALSIADKLDTVTSFFAIDVIPSGSQDPYALRRQASGIVETLLSKKWDLNLEQIVEMTVAQLENDQVLKVSSKQVIEDVLKFFQMRLKHKLQELKISYDIIDAVLSSEKIGLVPTIIEKAQFLQAEKVKASFKDNVEALSRVLNIARDKEQTGQIDETLFQNDAEKNLYDKYSLIKAKLKENVSEEEHFNILVSAQAEINDYFEHTMIMVEEEAIRNNRLNQMIQLAQLIQSFANVNKIILK